MIIQMISIMCCRVRNISNVSFKTKILEIANLGRLFQNIMEKTLIKLQYTGQFQRNEK